jgi:hypothetical protein
MAGLIGFGVTGLNAQHGLDVSCSPKCTDAQISASGVRMKYLIADVSLGVGLAGFVATGLAIIFRPTKERPATKAASATTVSLSVVPTPQAVFGGVVLAGM